MLITLIFSFFYVVTVAVVNGITLIVYFLLFHVEVKVRRIWHVLVTNNTGDVTNIYQHIPTQ